MNANNTQRIFSASTIFLIALAYFLFQWFYIPNEIITADEFVFARHLIDYTNLIPYRDFLPYKSVVGHYLLSIPLFFSKAILTPIYYIKIEIALINTLCIALTMLWGSQLFGRKSVFLATLLILANQFSLFYTADLRVDMMASWLCLFSALAVLQNRFRLSGLLIGLAFLISQKAIWYLVALNGSMLICYWLIHSYSLRHIFIFNLFASLPTIFYLFCWSLIASPTVVLSNFFYDAFTQATIDYYMEIYALLWQAMLSHGPILFLLWPLTFMMIITPSKPRNDTLFITCFSAIAFILFINYKQAFAYNFVFTLPAFFVLYSAFFSWLDNSENKIPTIPLYLIILYAVSINAFVYLFSLPVINYFISLFPLIFIVRTSVFSRIRVFYFLLISIGIIYPLCLTYEATIKYNGEYQQTMVRLTHQLTVNEGDYVAGVPLLFQHDQPIPGLKNLISPQITFLSMPDDKLGRLLLPSIYLTKISSKEVIEEFERSSVKLFITNFRTLALPPDIIRYVSDHYQHYYGSIYLYAPKIEANQLSFHIKFTGPYRVQILSGKKVVIDGKQRRDGQMITLKEGDHLSQTRRAYRLVLVPALSEKLDPKFEKDEWLKML